VNQSTPAMEHFTSPSASDGQLFLATGTTVEAYKIASAVTVYHTLSVTRAGTGSGTVQGNQSPPLDCPATCSQPYPAGATVILTETPAQGSAFGGWAGGGCSGTASTCTVTLGADASVTATFTATGTAGANAGRPTVSGSSLSGVATRNAVLTFTVHQGKQAPALKTIVVALPAGLSFDRKGLAKGLTVGGPKGHLRFTTALRRGVLAIALKSAHGTVKVTFHGRAITVSKKLAAEAKHKRRPRLRIIVTAIDTSGKATKLVLTLRG
jgi:hypothetical protein